MRTETEIARACEILRRAEVPDDTQFLQGAFPENRQLMLQRPLPSSNMVA